MTHFNLGLEAERYWISGLLLTIFHVLLSFFDFNPHIFKVFEGDNTLSVIGNFSLLSGMVSFMYWLYHGALENEDKGKENANKII